MSGLDRYISLDTIKNFLLHYQLYIIMVLAGLLLVLAGIGTSVYAGLLKENRVRLRKTKESRYLKYFEAVTGKFPFKYLSQRLNTSLGYLILDNITQRKIVTAFTFLIPIIGLLLYCTVVTLMKLWYTKLAALFLCIMVPYYTFTLVLDYLKYNIRQKIPVLIDRFRSSFVSHNRIKPALRDCGSGINKYLGKIMLRVSDSSDLNKSLCAVRDRINDTWFNIFVALLINFRENGGELINQLYKLNKTITRYNNIEKKKNRRLIWYEFFALSASIFSLPAIMLINRMILGTNMRLYYNTAEASGKIAFYSLSALIIVRILRRL
ncbi:MAG TPA: type II secretion system protein F [Ruminiclostridium sp.]|nr:type II secretion system protein F [Ruminiclostridium sp.]